MELRHLRYSVTVAEELQSAAPPRLHMSQPPLSQQIGQLEHEVGAQLLLRNQHRVEPTPPAPPSSSGRARSSTPFSRPLWSREPALR